MLLVRKDIGSHIATAGEGALDPASITAAAGNDGVAVSGNIIDRLRAGRSLYLSAKLIINFVVAAMTAAKTLTITAKLTHGDASNLSDVADYTAGGLRARYTNSGIPSANVWTAIALSSGNVPATVVASATGANRGVLEADYDLSQAKRYLRAVVTFDLSATATDVVVGSAILVLGGADVEPAV